MTSMADDVVVTNNQDQNRYEAHLDGELAGFAEYTLPTGLIVFTHTEVDPKFEGRGVASALVRFSLDEVRDAGERKVVPICPFYKGWIERHPDYIPLVQGAPREIGRAHV